MKKAGISRLFLRIYGMKLMRFYKKWPKLHSWLLVDLGLLLLFVLTRNNRAWMNALTTHVTEPLKQGIASLTYRVEFSVAELLYMSAICVGVVWIAHSIRCVLGSRRKWQALYPRLLGTICAVLSIYVGMTFLWGVNYYTDTFQEKSGIYGRGATVTELEELTTIFAQGVLETWDKVERDENGLFAESREEILEAAPYIYQNLYEEFPFLEMEDRVPKAPVFSNFISMLDFSGFYFPFTGEANLNVHSPAMYLPATVVHELAHLRGIASEQECNFLGIVGATASENPAYQYSGWLMGYVYAGNALYRADPEAWAAIRATIPEEVVADLRYHSQYWASFEGTINKVASNTYDSFLKGYGDKDGIRSYGTVVDMLITYYIG